MDDKILLKITGDESSKSEIVYNNIIDNLGKEDQIKYLKSKVTLLEVQMKNKLIALILFLIVLGLCWIRLVFVVSIWNVSRAGLGRVIPLNTISIPNWWAAPTRRRPRDF